MINNIFPPPDKKDLCLLESLLPHLQMCIFRHLTEDDRKRLAVSSRRFITPRQVIMKQKKEAIMKQMEVMAKKREKNHKKKKKKRAAKVEKKEEFNGYGGYANMDGQGGQEQKTQEEIEKEEEERRKKKEAWKKKFQSKKGKMQNAGKGSAGSPGTSEEDREDNQGTTTAEDKEEKEADTTDMKEPPMVSPTGSEDADSAEGAAEEDTGNYQDSTTALPVEKEQEKENAATENTSEGAAEEYTGSYQDTTTATDKEEKENAATENTSEGAAEEDTGNYQDSTTAPDKEEKENATTEKKQPTTASSIGIEDPNTLLARLNTRRLAQRLRHYRSLDDSPDKQHEYYASKYPPYPLNKTTEEIAYQEWRDLVQQYRDRFDLIKFHNKIPSPYELLLFSPCPRPVAILASYPRSGNSLMRNLFERITLRVTGSDMRGGLTQHDMVGEAAVTSHKVTFVKTHYPERRGFPAFWAGRVVLLVRNPYDAIESYFNLMMTNTHTTSISEEKRLEHIKVWEAMALKEVQVWKAFHEFWLSQNIPLLLVRYEDLIRYQDSVMAKVIQFSLEVGNMSFFDERIDRCIREQQIEELGSYRPRSGGIGKSLAKYSPELLQKMNSIGIVKTMEKLGYEEMLVPNKSEWELKPIPGYGTEFPCTDNDAQILVNSDKIVRGMHQMTNWRSVRQNMKVGNGAKCTCQKCMKGKR